MDWFKKQEGSSFAFVHTMKLLHILLLLSAPAVTAFHIVDAELVQHPGDGRLVVGGEIDPLGLRPVPQRGVVYLYAPHG